MTKGISSMPRSQVRNDNKTQKNVNSEKDSQPTLRPTLAGNDAATPPIHPVTKESAKKINKSRWLIFGCLILAIVAGITSWHIHTVDKAASAAKLTNISVRLEWVNNPEFAGMYVAIEKGYYKAVGLNVDLKEFQDSTDVNKEVASGEVDYGVSTPLEVVLARDGGVNNKAIAAIYQTSAFSFVAQKKSNITSPSDFRGKILGDSGDNNEAKITYAALLGQAGIDPSQTTIKPVGFDILADFEKNQSDTYDVYRTDQTYLLDQAHIPYTEINPEKYGFAIYGDVLIASDSIIAKKPAQTEAFVDATMQGWQYVLGHKSETLAILAKYDNALYKDPKYVKFDLDNTLPLIRPTDNQPLGSMLYAPWNIAYIATEESGLLHNNINPSDLYTNEFVR